MKGLKAYKETCSVFFGRKFRSINTTLNKKRLTAYELVKYAAYILEVDIVVDAQCNKSSEKIYPFGLVVPIYNFCNSIRELAWTILGTLVTFHYCTTA
ncbi:hypothetical protein TDB9533_03692 [Thalassocella blandensis]|nr:hypothetical protein TDB9533_03692 [Thalassocella blandensis]